MTTWFRMPKGVERVQVALQDFKAEVLHDGGHFFRAPDHFAPTILGLSGFSVQVPPDLDETALGPMEGERDEALEAMVAEIASLHEQLKTANETNGTLSAELTAMTTNRDEMKMAGADAAGKLVETMAELNNLKQALVDKGVDPATLTPIAGQETKTAADKAEGKK